MSVAIAGHALEAGWMLLDYINRDAECSISRDVVIDQFILRPLEYGWDKEHGGIFSFLDARGSVVITNSNSLFFLIYNNNYYYYYYNHYYYRYLLYHIMCLWCFVFCLTRFGPSDPYLSNTLENTNPSHEPWSPSCHVARCDYTPTQLEWHMKLWWPHNEAMIALLAAYRYRRDENLLQKFNQVNDYCTQNVSDLQLSESLYAAVYALIRTFDHC